MATIDISLFTDIDVTNDSGLATWTPDGGGLLTGVYAKSNGDDPGEVKVIGHPDVSGIPDGAVILSAAVYCTAEGSATSLATDAASVKQGDSTRTNFSPLLNGANAGWGPTEGQGTQGIDASTKESLAASVIGFACSVDEAIF